MKTVGVVLAGCGFLDGAEIYESVLTLLALDRAGVTVQCLAPDVPQMHVINHRTGEPTGEARNVLTEAARLARGQIQPLDNAWVAKLDAVVFPGGFGAAKNYCDYAVKGDDCTILPAVESFLHAWMQTAKPIGLICISPVVFARAFKGQALHPRLTVGAASGAAASVEAFGGTHVVATAGETVVDRAHRIVSTPAYMCQTRISEVARGIEQLVADLLAMTHD
jgi:enhancing lycopene biosynthesis protein 2